MKKYLMPLLAGMALASAGHAALILSETFTYADGSLITNSAFVWTNHSGTVGQMQVLGGKAVVSQAQSEDVNAQIAGAPYTSGNLYASFTVNFSALPTAGVGNYFAHFKDGGTAIFRCRVFATITGAAAGTFRVGVANGGSTPVVINRDLSLGTDYFLVIRYDTGTAASTLWISPSSEAALSDRADGTDTPTTAGITTFALRQSNVSGGMGVLTLDDLKVGTAFGDVTSGGDPSLNPPAISSIPGQSIPMNGATPAVPFTVTDGETAVGSLTVAATASSNPTLLPLGNIAFTTDGSSNRTVMATPAAGQQGFSKVTVTVTDGNNNTASRDFLVIVGTPTVSTFSNIDIVTNTSTPAIAFTVGDPDGDTLTVSATSSNEAVVPISGIVFAGGGANRTVTITPATDVAGLSRITILVTDGFNTASNSFVLTVRPLVGLVFSDQFNYPDGPLTSGSSFVWNTHSGTAEQIKVLGGRILISGTNSEDVNAFLGVSSFPQGGGWVLYASFTLDCKTRPNGAGDYFAHFRNAGISFGARVFSLATGAAPGKFRLGLANSGGAVSAVWPGDLDTNVAHTVVTRINVGTGQCKLWVNPVSEAATSVAATDNAFPFEVFTYAFREAPNIGDMVIDHVRVGTSFADVVATRPALSISATGNNVTLSWPASSTGYILRYTDAFPANWQDFGDQGTVQGDQKVVTLNGVTGRRFFELRKP